MSLNPQPERNPHGEPIYDYYLVDTKERKILASIRMSDETAQSQNDIRWMQRQNLQYVLNLQEDFKWK